MLGDWDERELGDASVLIAVAGKLRGSRARQLGEHLVDMSSRSEPVQRVVLDLRQIVTIDSIGTAAIEEGHEAGLRLALVARHGLELDDGSPVRALARRGLSVHSNLEDAVVALRVPAVA
jgi:anti-anti-sigma regulatory factor